MGVSPEKGDVRYRSKRGGGGATPAGHKIFLAVIVSKYDSLSQINGAQAI
jgi:hypothetical protein